MGIKYFLLISALACLKLINAQVTPAFSANVTNGCPSLLVIVNDNSISATGAINSWEWTMSGPGGFSLAPGTNLSNGITPTLSTPGLYTISLVVTDNMGFTDSITIVDYIEVFAPPTINYSISPMLGCAPQIVCFDGTIMPGCGVLTNTIFDSNDGTIYNTEDFCHTYNNSGNYYDFVVSATNSCGCSTTETISDTVSVIDIPTASFTASQTIFCSSPSVVNLTNTSTGSAGLVYSWTINESVTGNPTGTVNDPSFNISPNLSEGTYDVELIVTEPSGCADTLVLTNYITILSPLADFTSDTTSICPGESIQFTDLSSGSPISWNWQFTGGGAPSSLATQNPNVTFTSPGTFGVELTTNYAGGCTDDELKIAYVVVNDLPISNLMAGDSLSCLVPFTTSFTSLSTNSVSTGWSFPGGTPSTIVGTGPFNITYNAFGDYNVIMFDTTANGCVSQTNFNNFISVTQLTASITVDTINGCIPVVSNLGVNTNGIDPINTYTWTLAGSVPNISNLENPVATYNTVGCFDVILDLVSDEGCLVNVTENNLICAGDPPIADFSFTPIQSCFEEESVDFTFTGTGADSILWNFGEGPPLWANPTTIPSHNYLTDIGDYTPSIIAYQYGCPSDTLIYVDSVSIDGPVASFDAIFESCNDWNTFNFVNTSIEYDSVYWTFGDASALGMDTSTSDTTSWTYPSIDTISTYLVTIIAYNDSTGCDHTNTMTINVYPPNADFTISDTLGCYPLSATLTNSSLFPGPSANTNWNWDGTYFFGPGAGAGVVWNNNPIRIRTYNLPGVYDIIMRNQDTRGCIDTVVKNNAVNVHGSIPGFFSDVEEGCFPLTVNFTDTSVAPLSYITNWHWNFGTGNATDTSNLEDPQFIFTNGGTYDITLTLTDSFGCVNTITYNNYIYVHNPIASFSLADTFLCTNQNVGITNLSSGDALTYNWQFPGSGTPNYTINGNPPVYSYTSEGVFNIQLEVTDDLMCTDDTLMSISIFDVVAIGSASADYSNCSNPPLLVNFTNSSINNVDTTSAFWDFGNGTSSTDLNPSVLYSSPGSYVVTLSISALTGCSDTAIVDTIIIEGPWGDLELLSDSLICYCDSATFAIKTVNANTPVFLSGTGQAIPFFPTPALSGDTVYDTLKIQYCGVGVFNPGLSFSEGGCTYNVGANPINNVILDSLVIKFGFQDDVFCDTGTVCFIDSSYSEIGANANLVSWFWTFGDGSISALQNPCHFYNEPGSYNVCLTVENTNGCIKTYCDTIRINANPIANFEISDTSICVNNNIAFYDSSVTDVGSNIIDWHWDFGTLNPADTSNVSNPTFTYTVPGIYNVCLTVTNDLACIDNSHDTCLIVQVFAGPTASETVDSTCLGGDISFDDSSVNGDGNIIANFWNFGTGNSADTALILSNNGDTMFTYSVFGNYSVIHVVVDDLGCIDTSLLTAYTFDNPTANYTTSSVCLNDNSQFTSTSMAGLDGENSISDYSWNFDEGASFNTGTSVENFVFLNTGTHNVSLAISDDFGCVDTIVQVIDITTLPVAEISISDSIVCNGETVNLNASASTFVTPGVQYFWDDNFETGTDNTNVNYNYIPTSNAQIMLAVVDDNNCTDTAYNSMIVNQGPNASFTFGDACVNLPINLNSTSTQGDIAINNFEWLINGAIGPIGQNTTFVTPTASNLTAQLIVTDLNNCIDTSALFNIIVDTTTSTLIGENDTILCEATDLMYSVSGSSSSYLWSPQNIIDDSSADLITASVTNSVSIIVVGSSENNLCPESSDTVQVLVAQEPNIIYEVEQNPLFLGLTTEVELDVTPFNTNDSVIWENNASLNQLFGLVVEASPTETTDFPFSVFYYFNSVRCRLDSFVNIQVIEECSSELFYVPNVFTPNDDGINDYFKISGISIESLKSLKIFNRWGQIVFEKENIEFKKGRFKNKLDAWDGKNKIGNYCNNGVYVFMYEGVCLNGEIVVGSGNVTIIR